MRGDPKTIEYLNKALTNELTAINQYFLHAKMFANWGFKEIAAHEHAESIDEMKHAQALIDRVLYLGGVPNVQRLGKINIGETVKEQLTVDLALENEAIPRLNTGIAHRKPGVGMVGAGILRAPEKCFKDAFAALKEQCVTSDE